MSTGRLVAKTLRLALPLYAATVVLALLPTAVAMLGLGSMAGDRPWRGELLGAGWINLAVEMLMEAVYGRAMPGLALVFVGMGLLAPLAMFGQMVVYSFLAGGILEVLSIGTARPSFWAACRRWFWPSFWLSLLGGVIVVIAGIGVAVISAFGRAWIGPDIGALLQLAGQAVVFGWLELARALMVVDSERSVVRALIRTGRACGRPLVLLLWLALALPSVGLVLAAILPPAIDDPYAVSGVLQALAFGQVVAFVGAWTKVVRLAVAVRLAAGARSGRSGVLPSLPLVRVG